MIKLNKMNFSHHRNKKLLKLKQNKFLKNKKLKQQEQMKVKMPRKIQKLYRKINNPPR